MAKIDIIFAVVFVSMFFTGVLLPITYYFGERNVVREVERRALGFSVSDNKQYVCRLSPLQLETDRLVREGE